MPDESPQQNLEFPLIHLSQAHLNLLETCPPQFQRIYLEQLSSPLSPAQQEKLNWGSQFHYLMQQRELGLPLEPLLAEEQQLGQAIASLIKAVPDLEQTDGKTWREAEHCRSLQIEGYLLTVIYDLLILGENKAEILDWKTYLQPENREKLAANWQTRLYLYILAETSEFLPEQISMTYWFVKLPKEPQSLTFTYNSQDHKKNQQDLSQLLTQLTQWLADYRSEDRPFPHQINCWQENCPYYPVFFPPQSEEELPPENWLLNIDSIQEIRV